MFGIGWSELLIILVILLLIFGSSKLPQLGEALGKGIKNFQKSMKGEGKKRDKDDKGETSGTS